MWFAHARSPSFVLGREFAGKSTLCKNFCLVQQAGDEAQAGAAEVCPQDRTCGVEIKSTRSGFWGHSDLQLIFLDFGGHSIYHAGQEFFLAESDSMAIVVLSPLRPQLGEFLFTRTLSIFFFSFHN